MGNKNNNQKNLWIYISGTLFVFALFALYMERHGYSSYLSNILSFIGIIVSIILAKKPSSSIPCNNKNKVQDEDYKKKQNGEGKKAVRCLWWNRNRRRIFISLAIVFALLFAASICNKLHNYKKQQKEYLLQRQFNELVERFEYRTKESLTFDNARQSLVKDSIVLAQIIQMLNENPEQSLTSKNQYINTFNERVDSAIFIIEAAICDTSLKYSEYKVMTDKYYPIIDKIKQMKIAL